MSVTSRYREAWEGFWREAPEEQGAVFWDAEPASRSDAPAPFWSVLRYAVSVMGSILAHRRNGNVTRSNSGQPAGPPPHPVAASGAKATKRPRTAV